MDLPEIKPLKPPKFWTRPTTKQYGLRTFDVQRLYGNSYREYKNNKMDTQAYSFVDPVKSADMPSSWCGQYQEPKFLTDTYLSLRRPVLSKDRANPLPRASVASLTSGVLGSSSASAQLITRQSTHSTVYGHQYLGGVKSNKIGGSSNSYARLEERLVKL